MAISRYFFSLTFHSPVMLHCSFPTRVVSLCNRKSPPKLTFIYRPFIVSYFLKEFQTSFVTTNEFQLRQVTITSFRDQANRMILFSSESKRVRYYGKKLEIITVLKN